MSPLSPKTAYFRGHERMKSCPHSLPQTQGESGMKELDIKPLLSVLSAVLISFSMACHTPESSNPTTTAAATAPVRPAASR